MTIAKELLALAEEVKKLNEEGEEVPAEAPPDDAPPPDGEEDEDPYKDLKEAVQSNLSDLGATSVDAFESEEGFNIDVQLEDEAVISLLFYMAVPEEGAPPPPGEGEGDEVQEGDEGDEGGEGGESQEEIPTMSVFVNDQTFSTPVPPEALVDGQFNFDTTEWVPFDFIRTSYQTSIEEKDPGEGSDTPPSEAKNRVRRGKVVKLTEKQMVKISARRKRKFEAAKVAKRLSEAMTKRNLKK